MAQMLRRLKHHLGFNYTQKSTRSILALKLSVARPVYPWVTATTKLPSLSEKYIEMVWTFHMRAFQVQSVNFGEKRVPH